jgi:DNA (cytosine-5)-methyltransferase 1
MERMPMTFGSLFAGIGGFDLGLERAGMTCKWQVEIDDYASRVLAKHWPDVPRHGDVRTFPTADRDWSVDLICGGFPCQDISVAGKGAGLAGARSGLWYEFARIIREVRPRWVIVENVRALASRGLGEVLGDLANLGFDAEWHCIPACAVGAPHRRERIWIVANANHESQSDVPLNDVSRGGVPKPAGSNVAYAASRRVERHGAARQQVAQPQIEPWVSRCDRSSHRGTHWQAEPSVGVLADGFPNRLAGWGDAMRALGNAVVPQVVEVIGRAILEADAEAQVAERR